MNFHVGKCPGLGPQGCRLGNVNYIHLSRHLAGNTWFISAITFHSQGTGKSLTAKILFIKTYRESS